MKLRSLSFLKRAFAGAILIAASCASGASGKAPAPSPAPASAPDAQPQIPQSVFVVPSGPKEGRNPFFPLSTQGMETPKPEVKQAPIDSSSFVLKGLTPSGPKKTAIINDRTFETGENGEVRTPAGNKVMIKCEEIRTDSVVILFAGRPLELKLRTGMF